MNNDCLDNDETKSYSLDSKNGKGEISFKGWNIKSANALIISELKEYFYDNELTEMTIISKKEHGYSCSRWCEGTLASDEGYGYYIEYQEWKKGLGKCTTFTIEFKLEELGGN